MHNHCINNLLNLEEVIVKKVIHSHSQVKIVLETNQKNISVQYAVVLQKGFTIIECRLSRIFLSS